MYVPAYAHNNPQKFNHECQKPRTFQFPLENNPRTKFSNFSDDGNKRNYELKKLMIIAMNNYH